MQNLTSKMYANAKLIEGFQIVLDDGKASSTIVDLAPELGTGLGSSSLELCVLSHAGCYVTILALVAKKMHLAIKGAKVKVEAVKSDQTRTVNEETFGINIKTDGPVDRVERLHKLTLETCPVGILFEDAGVKISYKLNITKE
jgi:putative redox protein